MPQNPPLIIPVPESISRIASSSDRILAWYFFILFARFEYALKRDFRYLKTSSNSDAQPDWDKFARDHNSIFDPESSPDLAAAVQYFLTKPPRRQLCKNSVMNWSRPQPYDESIDRLTWLLRMIRCVRNNLFHGGKFPLIPISDPSRDQELLLKAMTILTATLSLDHTVKSHFEEGLDE